MINIKSYKLCKGEINIIQIFQKEIKKVFGKKKKNENLNKEQL